MFEKLLLFVPEFSLLSMILRTTTIQKNHHNPWYSRILWKLKNSINRELRKFKINTVKVSFEIKNRSNNNINNNELLWQWQEQRLKIVKMILIILLSRELPQILQLIKRIELIYYECISFSTRCCIGKKKSLCQNWIILF